MEQRDPLSLHGQFKVLSDNQERLIRFIAITVCRHTASNQTINKGYFLAICTRLKTDSGEQPFGIKGSLVRRAAQNLLREYLRKWRHRTTLGLLVNYSPSSFLESTSAVILNTLISNHAIPQIIPSFVNSPQSQVATARYQQQHSPILVSPTNRSPRQMTTARNIVMSPRSDGGSRHERWRLAAQVRGSSALFHNDADFLEGYGVEDNDPGIHCIINRQVKEHEELHDQLMVYVRCAFEDAPLITGVLNHKENAIEVQLPTMSSLAVTHLEKMCNVANDVCGDNQQRDDNFSAMVKTLTSHRTFVAKNPLRDNTAVPIKTQLLYIPPPFTCNNAAFNGDVENNYELNTNILVTTNMSDDLLQQAVNDIDGSMRKIYTAESVPSTSTSHNVFDETDNEDTDMNDAATTSRNKRPKSTMNTYILRQAAVETIKDFVMDTDICVYVVFQLAIDAEAKRELYKGRKAQRDICAEMKKVNLG